MRVFVFQRGDGGSKKSHDGGMTINIPAPKWQLIQTSGRRDRETGMLVMSDEEYEARIRRSAEASAARKGASEIVEIDTAVLPVADYDFRDAWALSGKNVVVDIERAKEFVRKRIRVLRAKRWQSLDDAEEFASAAKLAAVQAEKQRLRDLPASPMIADAKTLDDLRIIDVESAVKSSKSR